MLILPTSEGRRGGRLSRPRHCIERTQPVPKAVYRSGRRDKHNRPRRDSNVDPLAPQSDVLTTRATATYQVCPPNVPLPVGGIWDPLYTLFLGPPESAPNLDRLTVLWL